MAGKGNRLHHQPSPRPEDPFMLEIATFAPHAPSTPAPATRLNFPGLKVPANAGVQCSKHQSARVARRPAHRSAKTEIQDLNTRFRKRAQSVGGGRRHASPVLQPRFARAALPTTPTGRRVRQRDSTWVTHPFDAGQDDRVRHGHQRPADRRGPDVPAGKTVNKITENVDLRSTFSQLAGGERAPTTSTAAAWCP